MFFRKKKVEAEVTEPKKALFSTHEHDLGPQVEKEGFTMPEFPQPKGAIAMDSEVSGEVTMGRWPLKGTGTSFPVAPMMWFASQTFIGYQMCAMIVQHWLINKACTMPAKDAARLGWDLDAEGIDIEEIKVIDKKMGIKSHLVDCVSSARMYGIRVSLFVVESTDPEYYQKPFNPDGVKKGSYKGISQIDPLWCYPEVTESNLNDPAGLHFYEPTFWIIGNRRYHRSHLSIYVPYKVPAFIKNTYRFGGLSIPQMAYERVYAAERTANEAPLLVMTKRLNTFQAAEGASLDKVRENLASMAELRDNHGVLVHGAGEAYGQTDTALGDLDAAIMTQYQLVAAIAEVPATKLLGTSPKGFGASGEYEESSYREMLESVQSDGMEPMLDGHYIRLTRSMGVDADIRIQWPALDSPTSTEFAAIELQKAQSAQALQMAGAIDGQDIRNVITKDKESPWFNLQDREIEDPELNVNPLAAPNEAV